MTPPAASALFEKRPSAGAAPGSKHSFVPGDSRDNVVQGCVQRGLVRVFLDTNVLVSAFAARGLCSDLLEMKKA